MNFERLKLYLCCVRNHIDIYLVFELNKVLVGLGVGVVRSLGAIDSFLWSTGWACTIVICNANSSYHFDINLIRTVLKHFRSEGPPNLHMN